MAYFKTLNICFILFLQYVVCKKSHRECGPSIITPGYTDPPGDITLKYGQNLDILCVLHEAAAARLGPDASRHMRFVLNNEDMPVGSYDIVNSSAIRLHIENHPKVSKFDYYCMVNTTMVCHNIVLVGTSPQDVEDFGCTGHNYENFTCNFTEPENYVSTKYQLEYAPWNQRYIAKAFSKRKSSTTTTSSNKAAYVCPGQNLTKVEINGTTSLSCTWTMGTKPQYRHSHDNFTFKLFANNIFGNKTWEFYIDHFKRVQPNPPENLQAMPTSPHSIKLNWSDPLYMISFPPGLVYRVSWCIEHNKNWTTVNLTDVKKHQSSIQYELKDLPYAHYLYDIRVSIRSQPAVDEAMWSPHASRTVRTLSKIPDCPPETTAGSFELLEGTASILVYWKNIRSFQENGENFSYHIEAVEDSKIQPVKVNSNYARFDNLQERNYTFRIWSKNNVGYSSDYSVVFFPAPKHFIKPLSKLVKVDKGNGEYDLEWTESSDPRVMNYTLFWCSAEKERPYTCDGTFEWQTVPRGYKNKTLKLQTFDKEKNRTINMYQFAISANGYGTSSGLLWADCTIIPGSGVKLRDTYVKKGGGRFIVLQWKLGCIKMRDIRSFNVSYCPSDSSQFQECQNNTRKYRLFNISTLGIREGELNITDLKPYTAYKFQVKPIVDGAESQFSEPLINNTLEDTPSEPRNLRVLKLTDKTIKISWEKPLEENGHLSGYYILVNGIPKPVAPEKDKTLYETEIVDLLPRTNYTVVVQACTTSCSSASISTSTDIGFPGTIPKPSANWDNFTLIVKWVKLDDIKVDFYEVQVATKKGDDYQVHTTEEQFFEISICHFDKSQTVLVKIRAVNVKDGRLLHGNWSERADFPCFPTQSSSSWVILGIVMAAITIVALMCYFAKWLVGKIQDFGDLKVIHDPTIAARLGEPKEKHSSDEIMSGDPLLPEKISTQQAKNPSAETSGCCSGAESVTSSVESAGHLSMSDSGTEEPRSPSLSESDHKDVSLRQRPNVKKPDYVLMDDLPWSTQPPQSGYSVIGVCAPPKSTTESESEYLPLSDISKKTSYMPFHIAQSPEPIKEPVTRAPTSGYVTCLPQEPAPKNTAYVVAGDPIAAAKKTGYVPYDLKFDTTLEQAQEPIKKPVSRVLTSGYVQCMPQESVSKDTDYVRAGQPTTTTKGYVPHNLKFESTKSLKED